MAPDVARAFWRASRRMVEAVEPPKRWKYQDVGPLWYALSTEWQAEGDVAKVAADLGISIFFPVEERQVRHARRTTTKSYPLFSCYLFAKFDLVDQPWEELARARGAGKYLGLRQDPDGAIRPTAIRRGEIEKLMAACEQAIAPPPSRHEILPTLRAGTSAFVFAGIFRNFTGVILHDTTGRVFMRLDKQFGGGKLTVERESVAARG